MYRGTTPTIEMELPFDTSLIKNAYITFSQNGNMVLNKEIKDCTLENSKIILKLTQNETILFSAEDIVEVQLRILDINGDAFASDIWTMQAKDVLYEGIMS